MIGINR